MKVEQINPHIRFAMSFKYPIKDSYLVAYDTHIYYILNGAGNLTTGGKIMPFNSGSVILIPCGIPYLFSSDGEVHCISINFDFTKSNSSEENSIFPTDTESFIKENIRDKVDFEDYPILNNAAIFDSSEMLKDKFKKIEYEFLYKKHLYREIASSELKSIISELLRASISGSSVDHKISNVLTYIHEHFSEDISNTHLAEVFGYHPYHLNRLMKSSLGTTLHQYLISYRIDMAKRFISNTDKTIFEISKLCGYSNFSNFSSDFKKKTGYSPLFYRERSKNR